MNYLTHFDKLDINKINKTNFIYQWFIKDTAVIKIPIIYIYILIPKIKLIKPFTLMCYILNNYKINAVLDEMWQAYTR